MNVLNRKVKNFRLFFEFTLIINDAIQEVLEVSRGII